MDYTDQLINACMLDEFPKTRECLIAFMFDRCRNEEDCSNLLGVYIGIVKMDPKFKRNNLADAMQQKSLVNYIIKYYDKSGDSYYSKWFRMNIERFLL